MTSSAENLKAYCDFELVAYGPNAGKMKIVAKPTAAGKRVYQEIAAGKWKTEVLEIKADLTARKEAEDAARAARKAKIAAIAGLPEIRAAIEAEERYRAEFDVMMDDENNDGARPPKRPATDVAQLMAEYPRAAAYLKAESWSMAAHDVKASAGSRALEKIISGDDYASAIAEMDAAWAQYCTDHIWD